MIRPISKIGCALAGLLCFFASGCKPDAGKVDPTTLLSEAWQYYRTSDFSQAAAAFQTFIARSSETDPKLAEAEFGLASTLELQRPDPQVDKARKIYETIIARSPTSVYAPWSALALARMKVYPDFNAKPDAVTGVASYQDVINRYPDDVAAHEAFVLQQALIATSNDPADLKRVITATRAFLEKYPDSEYTCTGLWLVATSAMTLKDYAVARDAFQQCYDASLIQKKKLRNGADAIDEASTLYAIATLSEFKLGDLEAAAKAYQQILNDFSRDWRAFNSRFALKRIETIKAGVIPAIPGIPPAANPPS